MQIRLAIVQKNADTKQIELEPTGSRSFNLYQLPAWLSSFLNSIPSFLQMAHHLYA